MDWLRTASCIEESKDFEKGGQPKRSIRHDWHPESPRFCWSREIKCRLLRVDCASTLRIVGSGATGKI
jgi:hypothetical protein